MSIMEFSVTVPETLETSARLTVRNWNNVRHRFGTHLQQMAKKYDKDAVNTTPTSVLHFLGGSRVVDVIKALTSYDDDMDKAACILLDKVGNLCLPKFMVLYERYKFFSHCQKKKDCICTFAAELVKMADLCEFNELMEKYLRDKIADVNIKCARMRVKASSLDIRKIIKFTQKSACCKDNKCIANFSKKFSINGNRIHNMSKEAQKSKPRTRNALSTSKTECFVTKRHRQSLMRTAKVKSPKYRNVENESSEGVKVSTSESDDGVSVQSNPSRVDKANANERFVLPRVFINIVARPGQMEAAGLSAPADSVGAGVAVDVDEGNTTCASDLEEGTGSRLSGIGKDVHKSEYLNSVNVQLDDHNICSRPPCERVTERVIVNGDVGESVLAEEEYNKMDEATAEGKLGPQIIYKNIETVSSPSSASTFSVVRHEMGRRKFVSVTRHVPEIANLPLNKEDQVTNSLPQSKFATHFGNQGGCDSDGSKCMLKCSMCSTMCARQNILTAHMRSCHGISIFADTQQESKKSLCLSISNMLNFVCCQCGEKFKYQSQLDIHEEERHGKNACKCKICLKQFPHMYSLGRHFLKTHSDEIVSNSESNGLRNTNHQCKICSKSFPQVHNLKRHFLRAHPDEVMLDDPGGVCSMCGKVFKSTNLLSRHEQMHLLQRIPCDICGAKFISQKKCDHHREFQHGEKATVKPFICEICGKTYRFRCLLKNHSRKHDTVKRFNCSECNESFKEKKTLNLHMKIHSGDAPFKCSTCGKGFINKDPFVNHMRKHSGEKPFICSECGKSFRIRPALSAHMKTHNANRPRPYRCSVCGYSCERRYFLLKHSLKHTGVKPFKCPICDAGFTTAYGKNKHLRRTHRIQNPNLASLADAKRVPAIPPRDPVVSREVPSVNHNKCGGNSNMLMYETAVCSEPVTDSSLETNMAVYHALQTLRSEPIPRQHSGKAQNIPAHHIPQHLQSGGAVLTNPHLPVVTQPERRVAEIQHYENSLGRHQQHVGHSLGRSQAPWESTIATDFW